MSRVFLRPFLPAAVLCAISALALMLGSVILLSISVLLIVFTLIWALMFSKGTSMFAPAILSCICGALVLVSGIVQHLSLVAPIDELSGGTVSFNGVVTDISNEYIYTIRATSGDLSRGKFVSFIYDADYSVGDIVSINGEVRALDDEYRFYNLSNGVIGNINAQSVKSLGYKNNASRFFYELSNYISGVIDKYLPDSEASFSKALSVGSNSALTYYQRESIQGAGVSHLVVVSGLHLGVICGAVIKLTRKLKASRYITVLCATAAAVLIVGLCSFGISAIRSGIIYLIMLFGLLIFRRSDSLNSLCAAVTVMLVASPYLLGNVSFLLSVAATFGLLVLSPILEEFVVFDNLKCSKYILKLLEFIRENICISFSTALATLPILIAFFGQFSLVSVLANLLLTFPVSVLLVLTLLGVLFSGLGVVAKAVFFVGQYLCSYVLFIIDLLGKNGRFTLSMDSRLWFTALLLVLYACLLIFIFREKISERRKQRETDG